MDVTTSFYILITLAAITIDILLAVYTWQHRQAPGAKAFTITLVMFTWWSLCVVLAILAPDPDLKIILSNSRYLGAAGTAPFLLIFALQYSKQSIWRGRRLAFYLCLVPVFTQLLLWTNVWHHLWLAPDGNHGLAYWIHSAYFYIVMFTSLVLISLSILRAPSLRRWQIALVLVSVLLPLIISVLLVFDLLGVAPDTLTSLAIPVTFTVSSLAMAWALYRHRLFNVTPLARETLIDGMQDSILVLDTEYRIVDLNPAAIRILSPQKNAIITGQFIGQVLPVWEKVAPQVAHPTITETELTLDTHGSRDYAFNITPLYDHRETLAGYLLRFHDITERKLAEAAIRDYARELEDRNHELDAFAHTVAHDLKNPLSIITGFSALLESRFGKLPEDQVFANLQRISHTAGKMNTIINELLLLASVRKLEDIQVAALNMETIWDDVQGRLTEMFAQSKAELIRPKVWPVAVGYGPWVEEVWTNYISNAIKYGGEPPHIVVGADDLPDAVRYWVKDNGPGLSEAEQAKLFTQFTRLHEVRAEGHGLGLSIVQRIVGKLKGTVGVESEPGKGSTFWFTLPKVTAPKTAAEELAQE